VLGPPIFIGEEELLKQKETAESEMSKAAATAQCIDCECTYSITEQLQYIRCSVTGQYKYPCPRCRKEADSREKKKSW
jgi:hypothetical protein